MVEEVSAALQLARGRSVSLSLNGFRRPPGSAVSCTRSGGFTIPYLAHQALPPFRSLAHVVGICSPRTRTAPPTIDTKHRRHEVTPPSSERNTARSARQHVTPTLKERRGRRAVRAGRAGNKIRSRNRCGKDAVKWARVPRGTAGAGWSQIVTASYRGEDPGLLERSSVTFPYAGQADGAKFGSSGAQAIAPEPPSFANAFRHNSRYRTCRHRSGRHIR
jgi:hypothetical protein